MLDGGKDFYKVMKAGRKQAFFFRIKRKDGFVVSLNELLKVVKQHSERYDGVRQIPVKKIVGTEDRSQDFSLSYLPLKSNMESRWTTVRNLLLSGKIPDAIQVSEYGGYYFVRDGNHRVSVAKTHGIEFLDGEVRKLIIPIHLPKHINHSKIPIFVAKYKFHEETHLFDYIPDEKLGDACPESWEKLKQQIFIRFKGRVEERKGSTINDEELIRQWYEDAFSILMLRIRREAVPALFPGKYDLDIYSYLISYLSELPSDTPPGEAFNQMIRKAEQKHRARIIIFLTKRFIKRLTSTSNQERQDFYRVSRLPVFRPEAYIHEGRRDWYRFLTGQLLTSHYGYLQQKLNRRPYRDELVESWYDTLYKPAFDLYSASHVAVPFPVFYMRWMESWKKQIINIVKKLGYVKALSLEESFHNYLRSKGYKNFSAA